MEREPVYTIMTRRWGNGNVFLHNGLKVYPVAVAYSSHENAMECVYNMALEETNARGVPATFIEKLTNAYKIEFNEEECIIFAVVELTWKD